MPGLQREGAVKKENALFKSRRNMSRGKLRTPGPWKAKEGSWMAAASTSQGSARSKALMCMSDLEKKRSLHSTE